MAEGEVQCEPAEAAVDSTDDQPSLLAPPEQSALGTRGARAETWVYVKPWRVGVLGFKSGIVKKVARKGMTASKSRWRAVKLRSGLANVVTGLGELGISHSVLAEP